MSETHLELILETLPGIDREQLRKRLLARGFEALPMKVGVLLAGDVSALEKLLPTIRAAAAGELPVPDELRDLVRSIHVVTPRSLH
jgi:ribosomal 50S subunit-associated protein YjgA (DUF615 family)